MTETQIIISTNYRLIIKKKENVEENFIDKLHSAMEPL